MPTLYTSLLAHRKGSLTLAPKGQRAPVPKETESLSHEEYSEHVSSHYATLIDELAAVAPTMRSIGIIGAGLAASALHMNFAGAVTMSPSSKHRIDAAAAPTPTTTLLSTT